MMKHLFILTSFLFFFESVSAQKDWDYVNPNTFSDHINCVHFFNANIGIVAGNNSSIYKTYDGGVTWHRSQFIEDGNTFTKMDFVNATTGFLLAQNYNGANIFKTIDAGENWILVSTRPEYITDMDFVDINTGYLSNYSNIVLKTTDGASTWQQLPNSPVGFYHIHFVNSSLGFGVSFPSPNAYKTTDGGLTWVPKVISTLSNTTIEDIQMRDALNGYFVGRTASNGKIFYTNDGGETFSTQYTGGSNSSFRSVYVLNSNDAWAVGSHNGVIAHTSNSNTWVDQSFALSGVQPYLNDVHFVNANVGFAVGYYGNLLKTVTGGSSWQNLTVNNDNNFTQVSFKNENDGVIVGGDGKILKISNLGNQLDAISSGTNKSLASISRINDELWVAGDSVIIKSNDGGNSWSPSNLVLNSAFHYDITFKTNLLGWVTGFDKTNNQTFIAKTTNGGISWTIQYQTTENIFSLHFVDTNLGFASGNAGLLLRTINGGQTWSVMNSNTGSTISNVYFIDSSKGFFTSNSALYSTTDGGNSWNLSFVKSFSVFNQISFADSQNGVINGIYNIYRTYDGGKSWHAQTNPGIINHAVLISSNLGFAVGLNGAIIRFSNWACQNTETFRLLNDIHFLDNRTGFAVGNFGVLKKTENGGGSWLNLTSGTTNNLNCVHFVNAFTGYVGGANGSVLKTIDGGSTWSLVPTGITEQINDIQFVTAGAGYFVADNGKVYFTVNGGNSWVDRSIVTSNLNDLHFRNINAGYAVGQSGTILYTANGGVNWTQSNLVTTALNGVHFAPNSGTGWVVGANGVILKTINDGISWASQVSNTTSPLFDVFFSDDQNGWVCGADGLVLETTDGGTTWKKSMTNTKWNLMSISQVNGADIWISGMWGTMLRYKCNGITNTLNLESLAAANADYKSLGEVKFVNKNYTYVVNEPFTSINVTSGRSITLLPNTLISENSVFKAEIVPGCY